MIDFSQPLKLSEIMQAFGVCYTHSSSPTLYSVPQAHFILWERPWKQTEASRIRGTFSYGKDKLTSVEHCFSQYEHIKVVEINEFKPDIAYYFNFHWFTDMIFLPLQSTMLNQFYKHPTSQELSCWEYSHVATSNGHFVQISSGS